MLRTPAPAKARPTCGMWAHGGLLGSDGISAKDNDAASASGLRAARKVSSSSHIFSSATLMVAVVSLSSPRNSTLVSRMSLTVDQKSGSFLLISSSCPSQLFSTTCCGVPAAGALTTRANSNSCLDPSHNSGLVNEATIDADSTVLEDRLRGVRSATGEDTFVEGCGVASLDVSASMAPNWFSCNHSSVTFSTFTNKRERWKPASQAITRARISS
mmetsp:Transcript_30745/g.70895  ORF Transcript_30745/g.70895 Transcript_30745/m.70895 type:complete len:215 (+) Transcript_30745:1293-1937(+)